MGAGYSMMNDLTIIQTTQGLVSHLLNTFPREHAQQRGVVIGYDARHNSLRCVQCVCVVLSYFHNMPSQVCTTDCLHISQQRIQGLPLLPSCPNPLCGE